MSTKAGDAIVAVHFEKPEGYKKDAVDQVLSHAAAEVDAGPARTTALDYAPFPESLKGYHLGAMWKSTSSTSCSLATMSLDPLRRFRPSRTPRCHHQTSPETTLE